MTRRLMNGLSTWRMCTAIAVLGLFVPAAWSAGPECPQTQCSLPSTPSARCGEAGGSAEAARVAFEGGHYSQSYVLALCAAQGRPETVQRIQALHIAGRSAIRLGCHIEAERFLHQALILSPGHRRLHGQTWIYIGDFHERRKQHDLALSHYRRALTLFSKKEDWQSINNTWFQIGDIEIARGRYAEGMQAYEQALANPRNTAVDTARALDYLGYAHRRLGDYDKAIGLHRRALQTSETLPHGPERARAEARARNHLGLSLHYLALSEYRNNADQALRTLKEAVKQEELALEVLARPELNDKSDLWRKGYVTRALARIHLDVARLFTDRRQHHLTEAMRAVNLALRTGQDMGDREWIGLAMHALAETHATAGRHTEAEAQWRAAIPIWECLGDRQALGHALQRLAMKIHLPRGEIDSARSSLERALRTFESVQLRDEIVSTHVALGRVHERSGDLAAARRAYYRAIEILEETRARLTTDEDKIAYFSQRLEAYEALISLLTRRYREQGSRSDGEEAFRVSESARVRVLLDLISRSSALLSARVDPVLIAEERRRVADIERLRQLLAVRAQHADAIHRLRAELRDAEQQLTIFYWSLSRRYPDYVRLKKPPVTGVTEVSQRVLKPGDVLLEYFIGANESFLFVVNHRGLAAILPLASTRQTLTGDIARLRAPFEDIKHNPQRGAFILSSRSFDIDLAGRLYQMLVKPADAHLASARRIVIVPDGPLFHLPFETLVVQPRTSIFSRFQHELRDSTFWIDRAPPIVYALSASLLVEARPVHGPAPDMAAFVNPLLASAPGDVKKLRAMRDPPPRVYATGATATKARFLVEARRSGSLYVATHGELNEAQPMLSGFWLSDGREPRGALVTAADIFNTSLKARWFVLRACETGIGRIHSGEGVMGLTRALKYAGAQDLVLSLWSVDDVSSSDLMGWFYDGLSKDNGPRALHEAKRRLRRSGQGHLAHPFFWAPFTYWL